MEKIKSYFQSVGFNNIDSEKITSFFKIQQFKKDDFFVKEGEISSQLGFVEIGQFQFYAVTIQGEERTTYVSLENTFIASLLSYLREVPTKENIKALTNSILWIIDKKDVLTLQNLIPNFKDFYIKLIEYQICCIDQDRLDFITLTAEQRYEKLFNEEPRLLHQVPLQYIASMLGITPRHLSRLRKNI